jgi:uncharacterized membrane protein
LAYDCSFHRAYDYTLSNVYMKAAAGWVLVVLGIFILLFGVAAPSTTTQTTTTCYDDPTGYGQDCVRSSYDVPNTGKSSIIGIGIFATIIGGFLAYSESTNEERSKKDPLSSSAKTGTLSEKIHERQEGSQRAKNLDEENN